MNKNLILVKHSLPEISEDRPAREWHLSEAGRLRAEILAKRLIYFRPEILISSVEPKAIETAQIIATNLKLELAMVEGLHEHDRSDVSYLSRDEFEKTVHAFFLNPDRLILGSETANGAHRRFTQAVNSILRSHPNRSIVIVSHGTVISLFVSRLTGISDFSLWNDLGLPGFVVLEMKSNSLVAQENIL